jgi:ligand-binding sensor domain-containing protein
MKLYILLFLNILTVLASCNGQSISKDADMHSTTTLGNSVTELSKSILIVFQAKNGNYWFGSDADGVYRFDGKTIFHFSTKEGLSGNRIRGIQEDKEGNIYISTLDGISKFDGHTFTTLTAIKSKSQNDNWKLQTGDLWFNMLGKNGEKGPYRYDGKNLYQLEFPKHYLADEYFAKSPNNPWSPYEVYYIYKDSKGIMWFGTGNFGICRYDGKSLSWLYEKHLTLVEGGGSFGIRSIIEDKEGKFWFCNTSYRYNIFPFSSTQKDKNLISYKREKGIDNLKAPDGKSMIYFMSAVEDNNGDLWMATYDQGLWRYDGKNVTHYPVKDGAKNVTLFSIYKDQKGELWLGTHETGAYKFNGKAFEKFTL